jgi:hypothetical protein
MLTKERLEELRESCCGVAHSNWDAQVTVAQDENGVLTFELIPEDEDEVSATVTASPFGEASDGRELWLFKAEDVEYEPGTEPVGTLVPVMICGLLGL